MSAVIIDYGMGNVASVQKALRFLNIENTISNQPGIIQDAQFIILPGVGSFAQGMHELNTSGLTQLLTSQVIEHKKPFLGICLGMQLLATTGTEPVECPGLNWIRGTVRKIESTEKRIPHLGWNNVEIKKEQPFMTASGTDYYFIHSYHFEVENPSDIVATVNYGTELVAAVQHEHIFATQFHPEKSQAAGLQLLTHFFKQGA